MSERKNRAVVERYPRLTLSGDLDELPEIVHDKVKGFDGEDKVVGLPNRGNFDGLRAGLTRARYAAQVVACEGEWVAVCGKMSATHSGPLMGMPASGRKVSIPGSGFFRVTDGKIAEVRSFWDLAAFLKQTALPPESVGLLKRKP